jgi:hypothetical protein
MNPFEISLDVVVEWLTLLLHIWKVLGSNLCPGDCLDGSFSWFSSVSAGECQGNTLKLGRDCFLPNRSKFVIIHLLPYHQLSTVSSLEKCDKLKLPTYK